MLEQESCRVWRLLLRIERKGGIDVEAYCSLLRACASAGSLREGRAIHSRIVHCPLLVSNPLLISHLFHMYLRCRSVADAMEVFDRFPGRRSIVLWTAAIGAFVDSGQSSCAMRIYHRMLLEGERADAIALIAVLGACWSSRLAQAIHSQILALRILPTHDLKLENAIISMYGRCGSTDSAAAIFAGMEERNLISWTSMITALARNGRYSEAVLCFRSMQHEGFVANAVTIVSVLNACADLDDGRFIHGIAAEAGFLRGNPLVASAVINMYGKSEAVEEARRAFAEVDAARASATAWNAMMSVLVQQEREAEALDLFKDMILIESIAADAVSFVLALSACTNLEALEDGKKIHAIVADEIGLGDNPVLRNCVLHLYGRCGCLDRAAEIFQEHNGRDDLVSCNTMIGAFAQHARWIEALAIFCSMQSSGIRPDKLTFAAVLGGCANLSALAQGRSIHRLVADLGLEQEPVVATALVDMYGRCGRLEVAHGLFDQMPPKNKNALAWGTLLAAYASRGRIAQAAKILARMRQEGVRIHGAVFVSLLNSCSHAGLLEECLRQFATMRTDHGIPPRMEHFGCVIDLLGRLGQLREAERLMRQIPGGPSLLIWTSFLASCRVHNDLDRAKRAAKEAMALEPRRSSAYTVLASAITSSSPGEPLE